MGIRALLVYPEMPPTYWSMRYALPFLGRRAVFPPLGLLTVAAMLPPSWELRLLDLNVEPLRREDVDAADLVLISAMLVQRDSFEKVVALCREAGKPIVAGGPYPTSSHASIQGVDHFVLGEAEASLPQFLEDFERGCPKACYSDRSHPPLQGTPAPRYELVKAGHYAGAALQFSRGCPHHCDFCDIVELFGHQPRTKSAEQFLAELDLLYEGGWRGSLFVVDDNFIGNRIQVRPLLARLGAWQAEHGFPFSLYTETTLDLGADEALMDDMVSAGFNMVFVGIETPDTATLASIDKKQNLRTDLLASVKAIQAHGLEVSAGFILGFDRDGPDIFERQRRFIAEAAIPVAMVGLLMALPGTRLHARLAAEGRLLASSTLGNNTHDLQLNFLPRMDPGQLLHGYTSVLKAVYAPREYFARCLELLHRLKRSRAAPRRIRFMEVRAFVWSLVRQTFTRYAVAYWAFLARAVARRPRMAAEIVAMAVKGHHFFTITQDLLSLERFRARLQHYLHLLEARPGGPAPVSASAQEYRIHRDWLLSQSRRQLLRVNARVRSRALALLEEFQVLTDGMMAGTRQTP